MHLEAMRYALYGESIAFLRAGDERSMEQQPKGEWAVEAIKEDNPKIPGYNIGSEEVAKSPITLDELETLKKSAFFSDEDIFYLRLSYDVLVDQVADLLKAWRGIIFLNPHLRAYDENPKTGKVDVVYAGPSGIFAPVT